MNRVLSMFQRWPFAFAMLLCAVLLLINLIVSPSFVSPGRIGTTLATLAPFVLVGFASTPAILAGGIDISVGPLATLINCVFVAVLIPAGLGDWPLAIPLACHRDGGRRHQRPSCGGRPPAPGGGDHRRTVPAHRCRRSLSQRTPSSRRTTGLVRWQAPSASYPVRSHAGRRRARGFC